MVDGPPVGGADEAVAVPGAVGGAVTGQHPLAVGLDSVGDEVPGARGLVTRDAPGLAVPCGLPLGCTETSTHATARAITSDAATSERDRRRGEVLTAGIVTAHRLTPDSGFGVRFFTD